MKKVMVSMVCLPLLLAAAAAQAGLRDPMIEQAKHCTRYFNDAERRHGIPKNLLAAISNTESGRYNKTLGMVLPWPWTINAEGKGYYFDSKAEALRKVRSLQRGGMKSIDIGCMQVNLRHHPDAFASLEQAFNPRYNVAYAAKFLRSHYDELGNWQKAVAAYHSKTPKYGNKYRARVQKAWTAITGKVNKALESLGTSIARREENRPSYRVISVHDDTGTRSAPKVIRPAKAKSYSLAMREVEPSALPKKTSSGGIALRPQDRLSSVSIVRPAAPQRSSLVRAEQTGQQVPVSAVRNVAPASDAMVSHHGTSPRKTPSSSTKPKFIFVE